MLNDPLNPTPPAPATTPVVFPPPPGLHPKTGAQLATENPAAAPPLTPLEALDQRVAALEAKVGGAVHVPDPFPKMLYHAESDPRVVNNKAEMDLLLSLGWTPEHVNIPANEWNPTAPTLHRSPMPSFIDPHGPPSALPVGANQQTSLPVTSGLKAGDLNVVWGS